MIDVESITYAYPNSTPVFDDFTWRVERGEAWAILGPSGCGKTTLLYLLAGLRRPAAGQVRIDGHPITRPRPHTGLILQDYGLLPWATVFENARLGLSIRTFYGPDGKHAPPDFRPETEVRPWLDRLGLAPYAGKYPMQISGGQRQRTAIARTLALQPDLILMDEPFSSLDAPTREGLQNLTLELLAERDLTLLLVTHAIEEAAFLGQKILLLGSPPNRRARLFDNPGAGQPGYRSAPDYFALIHELRASLESI